MSRVRETNIGGHLPWDQQIRARGGKQAEYSRTVPTTYPREQPLGMDVDYLEGVHAINTEKWLFLCPPTNLTQFNQRDVDSLIALWTVDYLKR